jgi:serine/threonine protein kinase
VRFGRYEILRRLGEGGFGEVLLARDPLLDREVAVKVPHPGWGGDESLLDEARALARLKHPGIVQVLDAGLEDGRAYIVLECVAGPSLDELLDGKAGRGRASFLGPQDALTWLRGPAAALDHAHGEGFLHRDLKPANLLLDRAPSGGPGAVARAATECTLVIADFGLAALMSRQGRVESDAALGDPQYAAPEAWRGSPDRSSDLFSLAAIFFRLVAGCSPLPGHSPQEILEAAGGTERLQLSAVAPDLPRSLSSALALALSARRHERPRSGAELIERLQGALSRDWEREQVVREALDRIALRRSSAVATCEACGRTVATGARRCPHCGERREGG